jgi:hypothetical protein
MSGSITLGLMETKGKVMGLSHGCSQLSYTHLFSCSKELKI